MPRRKQLRFTIDPDNEKVVEKEQSKYPEASFSQIINLLIRKSEKK